jgi:hypothetical protein
MDYFLITTNAVAAQVSTSSSSVGASNGTIIGGVVAAVVGGLLLLATGLFLWFRRRRRIRKVDQGHRPSDEENKVETPGPPTATLPAADYMGSGGAQVSDHDPEQQGLLPTTSFYPSDLQTRVKKWLHVDGSLDDTLGTTCVESLDTLADREFTANRSMSLVPDTFEPDSQLLEAVLKDVSSQMDGVDSAVSRGVDIISTIVNEGSGREQLLGLKGADARGVLQVLQKV